MIALTFFAYFTAAKDEKYFRIRIGSMRSRAKLNTKYLTAAQKQTMDAKGPKLNSHRHSI